MFWLLLLCMILLLLFPETVASAAADGAMLWWTKVFPALVPHLILTGLALRARRVLPRIGRLHPYAALSFLLGALGGYPIGARVLAEGIESGALSPSEAQRFSYAAGLMSPVFLLSFTAVGLFGRPVAALPLCGAVYGVALTVFLCCGRAKGTATLPPRALTGGDLSDAISDAMAAILRIGGCIVLCRVLAAALESVGLFRLIGWIAPGAEDISAAMLTGLLEMTSGCARVSNLPLPLGVRLSLCVFLQMFGGASVLLQTRAFLPGIRFGRYVLVRLGMATAAALLCYGLCLLLPDGAAEASASADALLRRGETLLSLFVACGMGLLTAVYAGILLRPRISETSP